MKDFYDLILVEDGEGKSEPAYTVPFTTVPGDLALIDGVIYEVMEVVERVPKAVIDMLKKTGAALMVERIYTLSWDEKKGSVQ